MCTRIAQRVDRARTSRPLRLSILPFQGGKRLATLSTTDCIVDLGRHQGDGGTRRYVHRKSAHWHPKVPVIRPNWFVEHQIRKALLLLRLAARPIARCKKSQDLSNHSQVQHDRRKDDDHIIRIQRHSLSNRIRPQRSKKTPGVREVDRSTDALHKKSIDERGSPCMSPQP